MQHHQKGRALIASSGTCNLASPDQALTAIMCHLNSHSQNQSAKATTEFIGHFIVLFVSLSQVCFDGKVVCCAP